MIRPVPGVDISMTQAVMCGELRFQIAT